MKYLNVANPYPSPRDYGLINFYKIIPIMFSILMIIIILKKYVSWYSKRTKYIGLRKPNGWKYEVPFYRAYCKIHGFYENSLQGWENKLRCTECIAERDDNNES